ncbi:MAG: class I SAM-dependent methyltransferase [Elusimicrobiota bacterium]
MSYDEKYRQEERLFGDKPSRIVQIYQDRIDRAHPVLDMGAGQGRNALYLAKEGYSVHAVDLSQVGVDSIKKAAAGDQLPVEAHLCGFDRWEKPGAYSAVLLFGIIPDLDRDGIQTLAKKASSWLRDDGLLLVNAFTIQEPAYHWYRDNCELIGEHSYKTSDGRIRTFLKPGELRQVFGALTMIAGMEDIGPWHTHGGDQPERHFVAEAAFRKVPA